MLNLPKWLVLKKLGIKEFNQLTTEKTKTFACLLPYMSEENIKQVLEQISNLKDMQMELVTVYKQMLSEIIQSNEKTTTTLTTECYKYLDTLYETLKNENLPPDVIASTHTNILEVLKLIREIDSENKYFLLRIAKMGIIVITLVGLPVILCTLSLTVLPNIISLQQNNTGNLCQEENSNLIECESEETDEDNQ